MTAESESTRVHLQVELHVSDHYDERKERLLLSYCAEFYERINRLHILMGGKGLIVEALEPIRDGMRITFGHQPSDETVTLDLLWDFKRNGWMSVKGLGIEKPEA